AAAKTIREWKGHDDIITHIALSQDGTVLATGGLDKKIRLWDVAKGTAIHSIERNGGDSDALAMARDGKQIAAGGLNCAIRRWDATTGKALVSESSPQGAVTALAVSPAGDLAAVGYSTNQAVVYDLAT